MHVELAERAVSIAPELGARPEPVEVENARTLSQRALTLVRAFELRGDTTARDQAFVIVKTLARELITRNAGRKAVAPYFDEHSIFDHGKRRRLQRAKQDESLTLEGQLRPLSALVAVYRLSRSRPLLRKIRELHRSLVLRFHDFVEGGFFESVELRSGRPRGGKSAQSSLDVAACLFDLAEVDRSPGAPKYDRLLGETADFITELVLEELAGVSCERKIAFARPRWRTWQVKISYTASLRGQDARVASFLLGMVERGKKAEHEAAARRALGWILDSQASPRSDPDRARALTIAKRLGLV